MFTMNKILVKETELEINAYLNSLSLHQSFEEDDSEDDEFYTNNPSGSVLQPTSNPYNKQKKIAEANESLFAEEVSPKSPQKVKFNKVEKRICYDYFGSSFESDSIKSYEDEESEKESMFQENGKPKNDQTSLDVRGTHLQPRNPASKVVVTVTPKTEDEQVNSESESEDVCVGTVTKPIEFNEEIIDNIESFGTNRASDEHLNCKIKKDKEIQSSNEYKFTNKAKNMKNDLPNQNIKQSEEKEQDQIIKVETETNKNDNSYSEKGDELIFLDLENPNTKCSNSVNEHSDFYPCLANHAGITIRITGADSIESVESDISDSEVQTEENLANNLYNIVEFRPENKTFVSKAYQNSRVKETTYKVSTDTFILKGTKSTQNIRSPKSSKKLELGPIQKSNSTKKENQKETNVSKHKTEKTEQIITLKVQKPKQKEMSFKSKHLEDDSYKKTEDCCSGIKKVRPKSCIEKESVKVKTSSRPLTAPVKRSCCQWGQPHLPEYNGLRSEYGLSAEQLMERKRHKMESLKIQKQRKEQKYKEEQEKRKENEAKFIAWLEDKRKQAQMQFLRNQKIQAESGIKIYPAPTAHLKRTGAVRSRRVFKSQRKCVSLEELLSNASSHDKKTYKIYLGLSFE